MTTFIQPPAKDDRVSDGYHYEGVTAIYELCEVEDCKTINTVKFVSMLTLAGLARKYAKRGYSVELTDGGKCWIGNSVLYINWSENDNMLTTGAYISHKGFDDGINCASALIEAIK